MRLNKAIRLFCDNLLVSGKSQYTIRTYSYNLNRLTGFIGSPDMQGITQEKLQSFLASLVQRGLSAASLNQCKASLRSFFEYLIDSGYLEKNSMSLIKNQRIPAPETSFLTKEEVDKLRKCLQARKEAWRDYMIINMFLFSGLRLSELCSLNVNDVKGDSIRVIGKGNKAREIPISTTLKYHLQQYLRKREKSDTKDPALFLSKFERRLGQRSVEKIIRKWIRAIGITRRIRVHDLRHTFATSVYASTKDILVTQILLGHRDVKTTQRYSHLVDSQLKDSTEYLYQ